MLTWLLREAQHSFKAGHFEAWPPQLLPCCALGCIDAQPVLEAHCLHRHTQLSLRCEH